LLGVKREASALEEGGKVRMRGWWKYFAEVDPI
jgi:hypothetical protein